MKQWKDELMRIVPENTVFVVLCFEGPDVYSMAGGLSSRTTHLTNALAEMGFQVHHIFIGDPQMEGEEAHQGGRLILHRWCQWISEHYPGGVYDGEEGKLSDFTESVPSFVVKEIAAPAISDGKSVVILGEEWHTAEAMYCISDLLYYSGLREKALMFWNANNTYGFERIDWQRLSYTTTITTVSKYMKQIMLEMGINPLVIPNGIPKAILSEVREKDVSTLREILGSNLILSKVARLHPDKGWKSAILAVENLKRSGVKAILVARGGGEAYGMKIAGLPRSPNIIVEDIQLHKDSQRCYYNAMLENDFAPYFEAINKHGSADVLNLLFPIPYPLLQVIYKASNVVLANSIHEPFGLVGLEAMAAGAVVFCGCSGEDYATHMYNAVVLDTYTADEINFYIDYLYSNPDTSKSIGNAARLTAEQWTWQEVVRRLLCKLEYQAKAQGIDLPSRVEHG
ncbi:MAG: glycosyltransferase family 4 protein [Chloroflexota bacterium]|nr:MAG: glycosyltransferase family 4 protein [Chloroflexota bacterium]